MLSVFVVKRFFTIALTLLLIASAKEPAKAQEKSPIQATDILKIRRLGDVQVAPDHRNVAYTVRRATRPTDSTYAYRTQLWVAPANGRRSPYPLTRGVQSASQPAWDPSGNRLAFVRKVDGNPQVFVLPFYGGEAYQLTRFTYGATNPRWSPDGKRILFSAQLPYRAVQTMTEKPAPAWVNEDAARSAPDPDGAPAEARAWLDRHEQHNDALVAFRSSAFRERSSRPRYRHVFVQKADPDAPPRDLTPGFYSFDDATWLPNKKQIVAVGDLRPRRSSQEAQDQSLFLIDVADGARYSLLDMDDYSLFAPRVSPDGQHIAFLARSLSDTMRAQVELGRYALDGRSAPAFLTKDVDYSVHRPRWDSDSWHLYVTAHTMGGASLYRLAAFGDASTPRADTLAARAAALDTLTASAGARTALDTLIARPNRLPPSDSVRPSGVALHQLTADTTSILSFDPAPGSLFFVRAQATNPSELFTADVRGQGARRLTAHNAGWLQHRRLARLSYQAAQRSYSMRYWTMKPVGLRPGTSSPLLLNVQEDETGSGGLNQIDTWHELQFLAGKGYGIVGTAPRDAARKKAAAHVLAIADSVASFPWLDRKRQAIVSTSRDGAFIPRLLGLTNRFQAAVAQRGVSVPRIASSTDSVTNRERTRLPVSADSLAGQRVSSEETPPHYAARIRTPLLIMHSSPPGEHASVSQSAFLYALLRSRDRPVEYVRYQGAPSQNPGQHIDRLLHIWTFLDRHVSHAASATSAQR